MTAGSVGPVLEAGPVAAAIVEVLRAAHPDLTVEDRGSYLRVAVPGRCRLNRAALEQRLGRPFHLPGDLEAVMPSFKGRLAIGADDVTWEAADRS